MQSQGERNTDKVDVADVGVDLVGVPGEFAERPMSGVVGVGGISDAGLGKGGSWVEEEGYRFIDGEVDTTAGKVRDGDALGLARTTEGNRNIGWDGGADLGWVFRVVRGMAI